VLRSIDCKTRCGTVWTGLQQEKQRDDDSLRTPWILESREASVHLRLVVPAPRNDADSVVDPLAALSAAAIRGDSQAVHTLLLSVTPGMLRAVRGVLAIDHAEVEDVLQEATIGLLGALPSFRRQCTVLHFACRIAVLTALAARRRLRNRHDCHREGDHESLAVDTLSPAELTAATRRRSILRDLCDALPPTQSEALILHCVLGYTVEEVADTTQVPPNTVRSRLRVAKEALRAAISSDPCIGEALGSLP
jgi:RNA polymerase sigma factor (sigma-70 family)